eukprot:scaffold1221_cov207-Amphora_coffeaeformis.AAC.1
MERYMGLFRSERVGGRRSDVAGRFAVRKGRLRIRVQRAVGVWAVLGNVGRCWAMFGRCWAMLGDVWAMLGDVGRCVGDVWAMLGDVGRCWAMLGDVGRCWAMLGDVGRCWAMGSRGLKEVKGAVVIAVASGAGRGHTGPHAGWDRGYRVRGLGDRGA